MSRGVGNIHVRLMLLLGQDIPASSFLCKGFDPPPNHPIIQSGRYHDVTVCM